MEKAKTQREKRIDSILFLYILEFGGDYIRGEDVTDETYLDVEELIKHSDEIEDILDKSLTNWKLNRLNLVDKAILKYAVYEMKYKNIPYQVAINEALEITKIYSDIDGKQVSFNNKVLDRAKDIINESK